jgi:hypothetical protein
MGKVKLKCSCHMNYTDRIDYRINHHHCESTFGSSTYGLCWPPGPCKGCDVEGLNRLHQTLRLSIVLRQQQLDNRHEYDQLKQHDENESK